MIKSTKVKAPPKETTKKVIKNLRITVSRQKGGKIQLYIKAPKELELFFKELSSGTREVENWNFSKRREPIMRYVFNEKKLNELYNNFENGQPMVNTFAENLIGNNRVNLAILRIVGISKGISIISQSRNDTLNFDFEVYLSTITDFVKHIWDTHLRNTILRGKLKFEVNEKI